MNTPRTDGQVPEDQAASTIDKLSEQDAKAPKKPAEKASAKPAAKAKKPEKPAHVTTRKVAGEPTEGQVCLGVCGKWKPLSDFGKTSKARGGKPMRRCRACIAAEAKARKAAAAKADSAKAVTKAAPKSRPSTSTSKDRPAAREGTES